MARKNVPQGFITRRESLGLSVDDVAIAVGISSRAVRFWESGDRQPNLTPDQTLRLCRRLKCSVRQLAGYFESEALAA